MKTKFNLPFLIRKDCSFCTKEIIVQPKVSDAVEDAAAAITVTQGCGDCGETKKEKAKSMFISQKVAKLSDKQLEKIKEEYQ